MRAFSFWFTFAAVALIATPAHAGPWQILFQNPFLRAHSIGRWFFVVLSFY